MARIVPLLRSPWFWSAGALAVLAAVLFVEQLHIIEVSAEAAGSTIFAAAAAGTATALVIMVGYAVSPWVRSGRSPALLTVAVLVVVGAARTWPQWRLPPTPDFAPPIIYPVLQSTVFTVTFGLLVGLTSAAVARLLESVRAETAARARLAGRTTQVAAALQQSRIALRRWSQDAVGPAVDDSLADLHSLTADSRTIPTAGPAVAARLRTRAAAVRAASHRLDEDGRAAAVLPPVPAVPDQPAGARPLLAGLGAALVTGAPFHPVLVPVIALVCSLGTVYRLTSGGRSVLLAFVIAMAVLFVCERFLAPRLRRLPVGLGVPLVWGGYALAGIVACAAVIVVQGGWGDPAVTVRLSAFTVGLILMVGVVTSLSVACLRQLRVTARETAALTASDAWEMARFESRLSASVQAVSDAAHSQIQGRLSLVALVIDDVAGSPEPAHEAALLEPAGQSLRDARDEVMRLAADPEAEEAPDLADGIARLVRPWSPPLAIEVRPAPAPTADPDDPATGLLLRATRDAVANAARHGGARRLVIATGANGRTVVVDDDGVGSPETVVPRGLSYRHFIDAGGTWTYSRSELGGIRVTLVAPPVRREGLRPDRGPVHAAGSTPG